MAKIGLLDVDGHNFPNLALMKLSAYHKAQGDTTELLNHFNRYDKAYKAKVFTFTEDDLTYINADEVEIGGTGYGLDNQLPAKVESQYPDYSLYGVTDTAYGFLTRGCPRGCSFCIVADKEGQRAYKVADLQDFWNGQKEIKLLDPNLLASKDSLDLLKQLHESKAWIDFTQGLDIRLMTDEKAKLINKLKIKMIHFAWDNYEFDTYEKLRLYRDKLDYDYRRLTVYVLVNYNTTIEQDLERIYKLRELEYSPYVMVYEKWKASREIKRLQRWVNNRVIWKSCEKFEDYKP